MGTQGTGTDRIPCHPCFFGVFLKFVGCRANCPILATLQHCFLQKVKSRTGPHWSLPLHPPIVLDTPKYSKNAVTRGGVMDQACQRWGGCAPTPDETNWLGMLLVDKKNSNDQIPKGASLLRYMAPWKPRFSSQQTHEFSSNELCLNFRTEILGLKGTFKPIFFMIIRENVVLFDVSALRNGFSHSIAAVAQCRSFICT